MPQPLRRRESANLVCGLWVDLDADGRLVGSVGLELAGKDALIRGLAVARRLRGNGRGTELAQFALD